MKYKITFIIFSLLLAVGTRCYSQSTYIDAIFHSHGGENASGVILKDSFYYVFGHKVDTTVNFQGIYFYKLDLQGNLADERFYGKEGSIFTCSYSEGFIQNIDSGFVAISSIFDSVSIGGRLRIYSKILFLDDNLDTIHTQNFYDTISPAPDSYLNVEDIALTPDSGFIITGSLRTDTAPHTCTHLMKLDRYGTMEWQKFYGINARNLIPRDLILTPDSGFFVVGNIVYPNIYSDGYAFKTDKYGNEQWHMQPGGQWTDFIFTGLLTHDSSLVLVLADCYDDYPNVNYEYIKATVIKMDYQTGSIKWIKNFKHGTQLTPKAITEDDQGNLLIASELLFGDSAITSTGYIGALLKLNQDGDSIFFRSYSHIKMDHNEILSSIYDIKPTLDYGCIMVGECNQLNPVYQLPRTWILKVDSFGCDTPGCQNVGIKMLLPSYGELTVYPVPASEHINIELPSVFDEGLMEIYDARGLLIEQIKVPSGKKNLQKDIASIAKGIYLLSLKYNNLIFNAKFIKN